MFNYNVQVTTNFHDGYCMDCGVRFVEAIK